MNSFPILVVAACAVFASITDVSRFKVYNFLTFPCFFGGLLYAAIAGGWGGLLLALGGAVLGLGILIMPYWLGGLGAGDVKFVMAMGTWLGPVLLLPAMLIGCLATGIYSFAIIMREGGFRNAWLNIQLMFARLGTMGKHLTYDDDFESVQAIARTDDRRNRLIPFSAMISVGVIGAIVLQVMFGFGVK